MVTARRPIAAGEELLHRYDLGDELEPGPFLTQYGFVPGMAVDDFVKSIKDPRRLPFGLRIY